MDVRTYTHLEARLNTFNVQHVYMKWPIFLQQTKLCRPHKLTRNIFFHNMLTCPKTFRCSFAMCWLSIRFSFDDEHLQTYNEWTIHQYCHQLIAEKKTTKKLKKTTMTGKSPFRPLIARQDISSWDIEIQINRRNPYQISHQNPYVNHDPQFFGSPRSIGTGD